MLFRAILAICLFFVLINLSEESRDRNTKQYKVVCYLGSWANYRRGDGKFLIEDIDPFICTHLIYGFAKLDNDEIKAYDPYLDLVEEWGLGAFKRFNGLKKKNPELTTLIAIGGWNEGSVKYSQMASDAGRRQKFVKSVVNFLDKYEFDGLDMDWEYPANRGGSASDKANFVTLLKELKEAFEEKGYLLTAAVSAGKATMDTAYDIPGMAKYMDFINVMAYDFHGSWESFTGHNAPLYPRPNESEDGKLLNVEYAIKYWMDHGAPAKKLVLGMGLYGRSFTLANSNNAGLDAPSTGPGQAGPLTGEAGMLGYNEICIAQKTESGWTVVQDNDIKAPYAHRDRLWVGYDDAESIAKKVEFLKEKGLAGGMVWSIETDDFRGKCFGHKYPLLTVINENLNGDIIRVTVTEDPSEKDKTTKFHPTSDPVTSDPVTSKKGDLTCTREGMFRNPNNCEKFYQCVPSPSGGFIIYEYECPAGTAFDEKNQVCTFRDQVPECD